MSGDIRKDFIVATIANYFQEPADKLRKLFSNEHLNDFLDASRCTVLCARKLPQELDVILDVVVSIDDDDDSIILFFKISPDPITPENMQKNILISSMVDSPVTSLYHVLSTVFMPTLIKNSKWSHNFDTKTTNMMVSLEKTLANIVRHQTNLNSSENVISSLDKEEHYWEDSLENARTRDEASAAESILEIVKGINVELKSLTDWTSGSEIFENVTVSLMDLWNMGEKRYPELRILQILNAIGNTLVHNIEESLRSTNAFSMDFHEFEKQIGWGLAVLSKTIAVCTRLTGEVWPHDGTRTYQGAKHIPPLVTSYHERLSQLERIRTVHRQLTLLLSTDEFPELKSSNAFAPFVGINPYLYNSYTEPVWQGAVSKFEKLIGPAEQQIGIKLKSRLSKDYQQFDLLSEFKRYMELIERPKVSTVLRPNRESLLLSFTKLLETFEEQLESRNFPSISGSISTSEPVSNIYHLKHMKAKLREISEIGEKVLSDLPNYSSVLQDKIRNVSAMISAEEKKCFKDWSSDLMESLRRNEITLRKDDPVIEFADGSRQMEVTYNGKLVQISEEAQQLLILGYRLPREVVELVSEAKKFVRQAQQLDQIATFHNTIGDRMIPSQRPMMLETAVALSKMVQEQNGIVWSNTAEVDKYILNLTQLVKSLARQNNQLSSLHIQIKEKVMTLFETDLIKQQQRWKEVLKQIRQIIKDVESQGYKNMKSWKNHWDRQLFKALEVQFLKSLASINDDLPEINAELVYRQGCLQFKPPLEELRQLYYGNIRKFLNIPIYFKGVNEDVPESEQIFPVIVKRHGHRFERIYRDGEQLFDRLVGAQARFVEWIALGSADIEMLSKKFLVSSEDWERNFRVSKNKGQEIIRLNCSDERIGCFVLSFKLLRLEIELLNRKYWEILVTLLNNSIIQEMVTVERFLQEGIEKLKEDPQSVEEITKSNQTKEALAIEMPKMKDMADEIEKKNKTLVTWTKEKVDLGRVRSFWDQFQSLMENHQLIIGRQVENLKVNLQGQARQVNNEMEHFKLRWDELKPMSGDAMKNPQKFDETIEFIEKMKEEWEKLMAKQKHVAESCENLHMDTVEFPYMEQVDQDLETISMTWEKLGSFRKELREFEEEDWIIFRAKPYRFEEFLQRWDETFRKEQKSELIIKMLRDIESYSGIIQNMKFIRGDIFSEKHWYELYSLLEMSSKPLGQLKVGDFLQPEVRERIGDKVKELKELNTRASGEIVVQQALNELDGWEIEAKFQLIDNKDSRNGVVPIIQDFKSVLNKLGDNQSLLQSIRTSPFYGNFQDRIGVWEGRLADLDEYLQSLNKIQRRWIYLEPIFSHGVLETEQQRFRRIDDDFRLIMEKIKSDPRVINLCKITGIRNRLNMLLDQLARCQSSLNEFLEKKRSGFPRFYFIGDDDLLEILGQSTKPAVIQAHLKKLFAGIYNVEFDPGEENITAMRSLEGEVVPLKSKVRIVPNVEEWLMELSNEMKYTLKSSLLDCISDVKHHQRDLKLEKYPAQILCLGNAIVFTERCEEAIRSGRLQDYLGRLKDELHFYTNYPMKNKKEDKVLELKLKDLILDIIHEMDVVDFLAQKRIDSVGDWNWQRQLRFYIRDDGGAIVRMADAEFLYSYEYQGNAQKLVHTPLTDKCYLTLTQGMRMGLGGNPYGPAGTGKTESVKALGSLLGRQVLVFNCDEGIDVKAMGRIFIGLSKCGAWGCFDEFNRLEGATLSAVSMQIQPIQLALKQGAPTVVILDEVVPLDPNAGIFVTLNPAGKGYGGRNKLPDNLKQLFRPVVMSQPDNERIAEVILYTEGFKGAKKLGKKLVEIFNLAERLLTPQTHYDWGLRALKTVLKGCGTALKEFKRETEKVVGEKEENDLVVGTLRLNTLPKLTHADCFRFDNLIKDVFPNAVFIEGGHQELMEKVKESCADLGLAVNEAQIRKCLELYEQLEQRMGVVIVGPPECGKSTVITLLNHALVKLGQKIKTHVINPKAMPRASLLGHINLDTRQWTDGVLTMKAQQVYGEPQDIRSWIILDGDIDPEWVESLNSVLDDNRLLTLPSGWRIKFGPNVNFVFETHDLSYASPATISRMGMIFMSEEDQDINGIVDTWLQRDSQQRHFLEQLMQDHFYRGVKWVMAQEGQVSQPMVSVVRNCLSLMENVRSVSELAISMIRGLGGHLSYPQAVEFAKEVFAWTQQNCPGIGRSINFHYNKGQDRVELFQDDDNLGEVDAQRLPLVHTGNVKRVLDHIKPWLENQESFVLIGPEGCGKSMILEEAFGELRSTEVATIHCSGLITPENVLQKLKQVCITMSTNSGRVYKSKDGERLILYFKGINLVKPDKWGTCQVVEFLQQILSHDGFYDKNLEWVGVRGLQIVASISVGSAGGIYQLSPRFMSRLRVCTMIQPETDQLFTICHAYLSRLVQNFLQDHPISRRSEGVENLARGMVTVYTEVRNSFTPVHQSHYQFTPRDLTQWVVGLMRYDIEGQGQPEAEVMKLLYNAWAFEGCRIFRDKLVSQEEKTKFDDLIMTPVLSGWGVKEEMKQLLEETCWISGPAYQILNSSAKSNYSPLFGNTLYKVSVEELITVVGKGMLTFSRENRVLNIVVIPELLNNVAYMDRVLSFPCSSLVLAGRAGVGRRTALSVVSALQRAVILTLKVGRGYGVKQFKNDLKGAIQLSAVEGNKVFFVVEDFQLVNKVFLDMLNSLLSSGEIPGLYSPEELETIIAMLRDNASAEGYNHSLYSYFALRVRRLLQIVLIMDYTNENFIPACQSNPAIYKQCSMLWLDNWSQRTLKMIPLSIIKKFYEKTDGDHTGFRSDDQEKRQQFIGAFRTIFQSLPKEWTYPRRYVTLIHNYAMLYNKKRVNIVTKMEKLKAGVSKLNEAKEVVEKLKAGAGIQEVTLAEKQSEANKALEMITITMKSANMQRGEMEVLKEKTLKENDVLLEQKKSIDLELKEIEPLVQMAKSAVGSIKNEALSEIRSLRAPPDVIRDILEGVLRLMGIRDMSWNSMKTFLAKRGVKDDIRNFDARHIHSEDREAVDKLLVYKAESFDPKYAKRASAAAAPLAEWVIANVKFSRVLEKIEPLERKQRQLEENLRLAESQMEEISSELLSVDERVQQLKGKLNQYTKEAAEIEFHLSKAKQTLQAAEGLVGKLDDEFGRWKEELQDLDLELEDLPMYSLLAAGFITYLCDAPEDMRVEYLGKWCEELNKNEFDFCRFLCSERDLLQWQALGLPSDKMSQENAIMIFQLSDGNVGTCSRPYMIDPSSRATEWLKNFLAQKRQPTVISLQHPNFQNELELAIRFGKILVVQEVDTIEPILVPILRGDLVSQGSREVVQIADKVIDYNPDFRLFLCTRTPNPVINPDAGAVLTVVNFTTTRAGLTSQLLSTTLSFEKPEIEGKKKELVKNIEGLKIELSTLGESLLQELATAQGNILENKELLESLNKTKASSMAITESLAESSELEAELNNEISDYQPFAEFGSCLYFAILDTAKLNNMYQFSLTAFAGLFERALTQSHAAGDLTTHITHLKTALESLVYEYVCRSLFKADRLAFAIHLSHAMHPQFFQENEWEAFTGQLVTDLKGSTASTAKDVVPGWIDEDRTFPVYLLSLAFPAFFEKLNLSNEGVWEGFYSSMECEEHFPTEVRSQVSNFQKMMLIQTLRPDRLHTVMSDFARAVLGRKALFPPPTNMRQIVKETVATEPVLILISSGADPSSEMRELAQAAVGSQRYIEISMGQGQIDMALEKMKQGAQLGHWICMKNLHLVIHWLDTLEKEIRALTPHENFRLWLTTEQHPQFPKILLQSCLKIAYEAPPGLKKNLQRTYGGWTPQYVVGDKNIVRTQSLFVLALFHAVVQERRTYIPQGWSKFYEFNESDLRAGADVLDQLFKGNRSRDIQWPYVHGLFEQAIYGGRVDNEYDLRVLISYLGEYFNEAILTGANPSRKILGPGLKLPNTTDIQEYYRLVESMPEYDKPSSFGLPSNIERSWQRIVSNQVIGQLKTLSRRFSDTVKFDKAVWHQELTPLLNLWKKLNQGQGTMALLQEKLQPPEISEGDTAAADPIEAFIRLEYFNVVSLMQTVHRTLGTMSKVIRGILVPSEGLVGIADSLLKRETPDEWLKRWEGPIDTMSYLQGIVTRALAVQKWKAKQKEGSILRNSVDLSDLLNPDTFLSAFKQHCARKLGVAMDELVFVCAWDRNTVSAGKLSCQITGLLLEGCSFNGVKLVENTADSQPITRVGDCTISWMSPKDSQAQSKSEGLTVPLYYNETRQKLIGSLEFPVQTDNSKWIQAGVALFLKN